MKKGFLRDRIAKRKEAEKNEFGEVDEDESAKPVDEFTVLTSDEGACEYSLYRESYVLTVTDDPSKDRIDQSSSKDDSFDVTQMTNGQFESFAEVKVFSYHLFCMKFEKKSNRFFFRWKRWT